MVDKPAIFILIQRDAKNEPFARVLYNGQDPFCLDEDSKHLAERINRKSIVSGSNEGLVFVSTETGKLLDSNQIDIRNTNCFISGSENGKQNIERLISTIELGANNRDLNIPLFVTDGKTTPIFINEADLKANKDYDYTNAKEYHDFDTEAANQQLINAMIRENEELGGKRL